MTDMNITPGQLLEEIRDGKDYLILDVREGFELTGPLGQIDGIVNIPVSELELRLSELEKFKEREIAVICQSGGRSLAVQRFLLAMGYKAMNVLGGMIAYRQLVK